MVGIGATFTISYAQLISRSLWLRRRGVFKKLQKHRDAILHGSGKQQIDFSYANDRGDIIRRRHRFEGVFQIWSVASAKPILQWLEKPAEIPARSRLP